MRGLEAEEAKELRFCVLIIDIESTLLTRYASPQSWHVEGKVVSIIVIIRSAMLACWWRSVHFLSSRFLRPRYLSHASSCSVLNFELERALTLAACGVCSYDALWNCNSFSENLANDKLYLIVYYFSHIDCCCILLQYSDSYKRH